MRPIILASAAIAVLLAVIAPPAAATAPPPITKLAPAAAEPERFEAFADRWLPRKPDTLDASAVREFRLNLLS